MADHAILSPSGASRWLACTPSARLEEQFPDKAGEAAREGTLAHTLGELLIKNALGWPESMLPKVRTAKFRQQLSEIMTDKLYSNEMQEHCENYAVFAMERFSDAQAHTKDAIIFLEQKLNLTDYVPEGFGTGDVVIIADAVMDIIDLKYGKGVPVSAEENKQMMLYSLGALREFDYMYDIRTIRMTIFQPRLDSISTYEIEVEVLKKWAEEELMPKAKLAFDGEGEYAPGKHCQFCRARAICKAHADYHLSLAKHDFHNPDLITDEDVADILARATMFKNWLTAVEEHALFEAVNNAKKWPGYKLVEGRSNRVFTDETKVADKLLAIGQTEAEIYNKKLQGITALEKLLGKETFNTALSSFITKPPGKPTLAPLTDKRPEMNSNEAAREAFAEVMTD